jgi:hypothetical protein
MHGQRSVAERRRGRGRIRGSRLYRSFLVLQNAARGSGAARRQNRQRKRRNHENRGRNRSGFGKQRGGSARPERRLRSHAPKSARQIGSLPALQQHNHDQEETDQDVNNRKKNSHANPHERFVVPRSGAGTGRDSPSV